MKFNDLTKYLGDPLERCSSFILFYNIQQVPDIQKGYELLKLFLSWIIIYQKVFNIGILNKIWRCFPLWPACKKILKMFVWAYHKSYT